MKYQVLLSALIATALVAATGPTLASERLTLTVTPNVSNAPSNVIIRARVAKHSDNRLLVVEADSGTFYRSSTIELDGSNAPVVTEFRLNNLPGGEYTVAAVLRDRGGEETKVHRTVLVLSRFGEPK
jgi:hypothetical protein